MKIVNVNKFFYLRGGAERAFFSLTDLLEQHGHEVIPFSMHHPLNLPSPYSNYFVSNVELGRQTSPPPSPVRRGGSFGIEKNWSPRKLPRPTVAEVSMEDTASAGEGSPTDVPPQRDDVGAPPWRGRRGELSSPEHAVLPRHRSVSARELSTGDHQNHIFPNAVRAVGRMFWSFESARKFDQLLTDTKPDLIHIHNIYHHLSPSILPVAKRHGIPVVMTAHDYQLIWPDYLLCGYQQTPPTDLTPTLSYKERGLISPWRIVPRRCTHGSYLKSVLTAASWSLHHTLGAYINNIDRVIVPSQFVYDVFRRAGLLEKKLTLLPHFIEPTASAPTPRSRKPTILFFGRLSKEKGVDKLLEMMHDTKLGALLRIAGEGPLQNELRVMSSELGVDDKVTFLGQLNSNELRREIQRAWCTVAPSVVPETFGYSVLESLACGTPVIASDIGAFSELIRSLGGGMTVTPGSAKALGDALTTILKNPEHWRDEAAKAQRTIQTTYAPDTYYSTLMSLYNELTAH